MKIKIDAISKELYKSHSLFTPDFYYEIRREEEIERIMLLFICNNFPRIFVYGKFVTYGSKIKISIPDFDYVDTVIFIESKDKIFQMRPISCSIKYGRNYDFYYTLDYLIATVRFFKNIFTEFDFFKEFDGIKILNNEDIYKVVREKFFAGKSIYHLIDED